MQYIYMAFLFLFGIIGYTMMDRKQHDNPCNDLVGIEAKQTFPQFDDNGKLRSYKDLAVQVYCYQGMKLYHLYYQYIFTASESNYNDEDSITEQRFERRDHFLVFNDGDTYGLDYDKYRKEISREFVRVKIDSTLKREWIMVNDLYNLFRFSKPVLVSSYRNIDSGLVNYVYSLRDVNDTTAVLADTYLSFGNLEQDIGISLSRELDSAYHKKLIKARFVYYKKVWEKSGTNRDGYESNFSLKDISGKKDSAIIKYFQRFKKDYRQLR